MEKLALLFSLFLFVKFISEVVCTILRAFEINKLSGRTVHFGKVIAASVFNIMMLGILTDLFTENEENKIENDKKDQNIDENNNKINKNNNNSGNGGGHPRAIEHDSHEHERTSLNETSNTFQTIEGSNKHRKHHRSTYSLQSNKIPPQVPDRSSNYQLLNKEYEDPHYLHPIDKNTKHNGKISNTHYTYRHIS